MKLFTTRQEDREMTEHTQSIHLTGAIKQADVDCY